MARTVVITQQGIPGVPGAGGYVPGGTDVAVADGGTGASSAAAARTNLGLGNVDNTSDVNKPVSTDQATALALKAPIASFQRSIKASDQNVVDTSLVNVSNLSLTLSASQTWDFEASVFYDSTLANDLGLAITVPAGATVIWAAAGPAASNTTNVGSGNWNVADTGLLTFGGVRAAGAARVRQHAQIRGLVINGATPGTLQLQARKVANTDATTPADDCLIYTNSFIRGIQ